MKDQVMSIVAKICNTPTNCRGLKNNQENINNLFTLKGIDTNSINVNEMPLNWNNQVVILYEMKETQEQRELFAGIGNDGEFYFTVEVQEEY
ncbi:hypothetical protein BSK59_13080 [Paenibacillus odorifer]|uniref:hypothetical protein n=1 Tax=Paenibacillus odorifer TaxID=189426 RepID=UPI00096DE5EE|nr:hypothetical protein [Paenibacillus odorifer]OME55406.1 hypothetical protein BSK59_13080 [Paenibacillus odorifer]